MKDATVSYCLQCADPVAWWNDIEHPIDNVGSSVADRSGKTIGMICKACLDRLERTGRLAAADPATN